jgi:hypothetical protein
VFAGRTPFARRAIIDFGKVRSYAVVSMGNTLGRQSRSLTSTPRPSLSLLAFGGAGAGSAPSSGGFEAVLLRGGMVMARPHGNGYSAVMYQLKSESWDDGNLTAVAKWQVMAEHVRRRVLEWKCETSALETLKWCRPFQNSTSPLLTAAACLFPHRSFWRQPSKSGDRGNIIHGRTNCGRSMAFLLCSLRYIQALYKVSPSSHPSAIPMLKAIN